MNPIPFFLIAFGVLVPGGPASGIIQPGSIGLGTLTKVGSGFAVYDIQISPEMVGGLPLTECQITANAFCDYTLNAIVSVGPSGVAANPATTIRVAIMDATSNTPFPEPAFTGYVQLSISRKGPDA